MKVKLKNLGTVNKNKVFLNDLEIYFSYETPVGFNNRKTNAWAVRKNDWGSTTGKLLNYLEPNKKRRVEGEVFEKMLAKELKKIK